VVVVGDDAQAGSGEDVQAEVAAAFGPLVVLFGQDGADEADCRVAVGEDADDVRAVLLGAFAPAPSGRAATARRP
jgi:hypothetical protein